jgi:anaerobic ribonucleoside-triphosphate reductase activating protein
MYQYPIDSFVLSTAEIPGELALTIMFNNCQQHCPSCHSPYLWLKRKTFSLVELTAKVYEFINKYPDITAILLMGGDTNGLTQQEFYDLIDVLGDIRPIGIYSGSSSKEHQENLYHVTRNLESVQWLKLGDFKQELGGLETPGTNQRFYKKEYNVLFDNSYVYIGRVPIWTDKTRRFQRVID